MLPHLSSCASLCAFGVESPAGAQQTRLALASPFLLSSLAAAQRRQQHGDRVSRRTESSFSIFDGSQAVRNENIDNSGDSGSAQAGCSIPVPTTGVSSSKKTTEALRPGDPTERKSGSRRPKVRHVSLQSHPEAYHRWLLSEILKHSDAVNLGKISIPKLFEEDEVLCEEAFDTGMWNVIEEHCRQAASEEPTHMGFPPLPRFPLLDERGTREDLSRRTNRDQSRPPNCFGRRLHRRHEVQ